MVFTERHSEAREMRLWYISVSLAVGSAVRLGPVWSGGTSRHHTGFVHMACVLANKSRGRIELALVRLVSSTTTTTTVDVVAEHVGRLFGSQLKSSIPDVPKSTYY